MARTQCFLLPNSRKHGKKITLLKYNTSVITFKCCFVFEGLKTKSSQDALRSELGTSIPFTLDTTQAQARIICFKKDLVNLRSKIENFCKRTQSVDKSVPLGKVILRYIKLHGETMLESLKLSTPGLKFAQTSDALVVSGEQSLVDNCCTSIQQFAGGLYSLFIRMFLKTNSYLPLIQYFYSTKAKLK